MSSDFRTEIIQRAVMVTCPDNDHGGVHLPPGETDEWWKDRARRRHPEITGIDGPTLSGSYVFLWDVTEMSDEEIIFQSEKIIKELY